jgi:hypothetical protein
MKSITLTKEEKDIFGVYYLTVLVDSKKEYTYCIPSEFAVRRLIKNAIRRGYCGRAMNLLKKWSIKDGSTDSEGSDRASSEDSRSREEGGVERDSCEAGSVI